MIDRQYFTQFYIQGMNSIIQIELFLLKALLVVSLWFLQVVWIIYSRIKLQIRLKNAMFLKRRLHLAYFIMTYKTHTMKHVRRLCQW